MERTLDKVVVYIEEADEVLQQQIEEMVEVLKGEGLCVELPEVLGEEALCVKQPETLKTEPDNVL